MKHLGDITKINGALVEPASVIIGGSPCQDLSIAGRREGLAGERSGLFMEQLRVIREMRCADAARGRTGQNIRPRWMVWENVPGAFSSNKGEDFGAVLHETIKTVCPQAPAVSIPKHGWPTTGCLTDMGGKWSLARRVFDAQFWGVPQRRKRITLVCDFGGLTAPEILFERQGVSGYHPPSGAPWQTFTANTQGGTGETGGTGLTYCIQGTLIDRASGHQNGKGWTEDVAYTLNALDRPGVFAVESHPQDCRVKISEDGIVQTLSGKMGTGGGNTPLLLCMAHGQSNAEILVDKSPTLNCNHEQPIIASFQNTGQGWWNESPIGATIRTPCGGDSTKANLIVSLKNWIVRRLTPLECERLQGYPDGWTDIGEWEKTGKSGKTLTVTSADSLRYKALGNSIALPPWAYVLTRLSLCAAVEPTMASLFDGIGGFPLIWEWLNGKGTCLWASEIEDFPIAVTKQHFPEEDTNEKT